MTWQAPWVWAGIVTIALPILLHLLGAGRARRIPFPSLRFFGDTRPLPTTRTRLHDLVLLAIRCLILVAAVAALAQPFLRTARRNTSFNESLARAIVLDTSASMLRQIPNGSRAVDEAARRAQSLADSATVGVVLRVAQQRSAIPGAVAWLRRQGGRGELVLVSDFQRASLDSIDLAGVPHDLGVRLVQIAVDTVAAPIDLTLRYRNADVTASVVRSHQGVDVAWRGRPATGLFDVAILAAPGDSIAVNAATVAATNVGVALPVDTSRHIAVVFPDYPARQQLVDKSAPLPETWMADAAGRIESTPGTVAMIVAADTSRRGDRLLLFVQAEPGSVGAATTIAAARRVLSIAPSVAESNPATIADPTLASWQRRAADRSEPGPGSDLSDGHWFWVIAIVLLVVETFVRRAGTARTPAGVGDAATS